MQLGGCDVKNPKDSHGKIVKGKSYMQVRKERAIYKEEVMWYIFPTVAHTVGYTTNVDSQCLGRTVRR